MTTWRELGQSMPRVDDWPVLVVPEVPESQLGGLRAFVAGSFDPGFAFWRALPQMLLRGQPVCAVQRSTPRDLWMPIAELPSWPWEVA